jgi:hypothetical protein
MSLCAALGACAVDRRLTIASQPPGAEVAVDGKVVGKAPLDVHFTHYGARRVFVMLPGYQPEERIVVLEPPWYGSFPFDVFSEVLLPIWRTDYRTAEFALVPREGDLTEAEKKALESLRLQKEGAAVEHARALRRFAPGDPLPAIEPERREGKPAPAPSKP